MTLLRDLAQQHDLPVVREERKWELARSLSQALNRGDVDTQAGEYLYAGSTALAWYRFVPTADVDAAPSDDPDLYYPLEATALPAHKVEDALRATSEGDPFDENSRPDEIERTPKLVVAKKWGDGYLLTFAVARPMTHVIHNFKAQEYLQDEFFSAYLRPTVGNIEIRASAQRARLLARSWLEDFGGNIDRRPVAVAITRSDWHELHHRLDAKLDKYLGKKTGGVSIFDTVEYTKADHADDMLGESEFEEETAGLESVSLDLLFTPADFGEVRLHVSVRNGTIFIRTAVPEKVIEQVRAVLAQIKA